MFCNFQTCLSLRRPSMCSEPMLWMVSFRCPGMRASQAVHSRENFWDDGWMAFRAGSPLERRVSLTPVTMLISAVGVNRTLLQRLLGGWAFAIAFRRKVFATHDVSCTAATTLPPSRRCRVNGALLDDLLLVTGLALLLETNFSPPAETCTLQTHLRAAQADASRP